MTMPKFHELFTDVLVVLSSGEPMLKKDVFTKVLDRKQLSDAELAEKLKSGYSRAQDRVHWAVAYLFYAEAVAKPLKGVLQITDAGKKLLLDNPNGVSLAAVEATPGLIAWTKRGDEKQKAKRLSQDGAGVRQAVSSDDSPSEQIERAIQAMRQEVESEVLSRLRTEHWSFMERAVLKVLLRLGYGADEEDLSHVGGPNDEGIDGIINQDKLGLDQIYVQSKRYRAGSAISGNDINAFMGAMGRKGVTMGVFITASHFTDGARKAAEENKHQQVVLIDGEELAAIMVQHQIGATIVGSYSVFKIDENFFTE